MTTFEKNTSPTKSRKRALDEPSETLQFALRKVKSLRKLMLAAEEKGVTLDESVLVKIYGKVDRAHAMLKENIKTICQKPTPDVPLASSTIKKRKYQRVQATLHGDQGQLGCSGMFDGFNPETDKKTFNDLIRVYKKKRKSRLEKIENGKDFKNNPRKWQHIHHDTRLFSLGMELACRMQELEPDTRHAVLIVYQDEDSMLKDMELYKKCTDMNHVLISVVTKDSKINENAALVNQGLLQIIQADDGKKLESFSDRVEGKKIDLVCTYADMLPPSRGKEIKYNSFVRMQEEDGHIFSAAITANEMIANQEQEGLDFSSRLHYLKAFVWYCLHSNSLEKL